MLENARSNLSQRAVLYHFGAADFAHFFLVIIDFFPFFVSNLCCNNNEILLRFLLKPILYLSAKKVVVNNIVP